MLLSPDSRFEEAMVQVGRQHIRWRRLPELVVPTNISLGIALEITIIHYLSHSNPSAL